MSVNSQETVTLTIQAQGALPGRVTNSAVFSGTLRLVESVDLFVSTDQVYLPLAMKNR